MTAPLDILITARKAGLYAEIAVLDAYQRAMAGLSEQSQRSSEEPAPLAHPLDAASAASPEPIQGVSGARLPDGGGDEFGSAPATYSPEEGDAQTDGKQPETRAQIGVQGDFLPAKSCGRSESGDPVHDQHGDHSAEHRPVTCTAREAQVRGDRAGPQDQFATERPVAAGEPLLDEQYAAYQSGIAAFNPRYRWNSIPEPTYPHASLIAEWRRGRRDALDQYQEGGAKYRPTEDHPNAPYWYLNRGTLNEEPSIDRQA
jgi:hypothetical protein